MSSKIANVLPILQEMISGVDCVIAIERVSVAHDGEFYNMGGKSIRHQVAHLDLLFDRELMKADFLTIGIGDGGNEIGMGKVHDKVCEHITNGKKIVAKTETDILVTSGISNWAG